MNFPLIRGARSPGKIFLLLMLVFCQPLFAASTNRPPTISGTPPATARVGVAYSFQPSAVDPEGQPLVFGISNQPSWAQFSTSTGRLSGTPNVAGTYENVRIWVRDSGLMVGLPIFRIVVASASSGNRAPVISGTPATSVTVGQAFSFTPTASDPDGNALTFSITNRPAWATFNSTTGRLSGTPTVAGISSNIAIRVSDGALTATLASFSITARTVANRPPVISGTPARSITVGQAFSFTPTASDPDGNALTFSITNRPAWATFNSTTGRLSGTPTVAGTSANISIRVSDGALTATLASFSITASTVANRAPVISGRPVTTGGIRQPYSFRPTASDADGDRLTFTVVNRPAWATFDSATGTLYGTPTTSGTSANIGISVSDGRASAALPAFAIAVTATPTTSVTVSWRAPTTNTNGTPLTGLTGFRVLAGTTPGQYSQIVSVPNPGVTSAVLAGLATGNRWYFVVTALSTGGSESRYSQEVSVSL